MPPRKTDAEWERDLQELRQAATKRAWERRRYGWKAPDPVEVLADAVAQRVALMLSERDRRLAISRDEAAAALGVSRDHFDKHIVPHIRTAAIGRRVVVPVRELESFLAKRAV